MEHTTDQKNWEPIEGLPKQRRKGPGTKLSKKRADHRNAILKDWGEKLEPQIEPKVPIDYIIPFPLGGKPRRNFRSSNRNPEYW